MTREGGSEADRRAGFFVVPVDDGAILADADGGGVYALNPTAAAIWGAFLAGAGRSELAARLVSEHGADPARAARDVADTLALPEAPAAGQPFPFVYRREPDGFLLVVNGRPACHVDAEGRRLRLAARDLRGEDEAYLYLRWMAPKVLSLRGHWILHAGAVEVRGGVLGLCGVSGAGKTTTARALADAGARLVSEDLIWLARPFDRGEILVDAEPHIRGWARGGARLLLAHPEERLQTDELEVPPSARAPLKELLLLDRRRRAGNAFTTERLPRLDGVAAIVDNLIFGSDSRESWRAGIDAAAALGARVPVAHASCPDGLDALARAARDYIRSSTS